MVSVLFVCLLPDIVSGECAPAEVATGATLEAGRAASRSTHR